MADARNLRELITAAALRESASSATLPQVKLLPGGVVVASGDSNPFQRESSAHHPERGLKRAKKEATIQALQQEGILLSPLPQPSLQRAQTAAVLLPRTSPASVALQTTLEKGTVQSSQGTPLLSYEQLRSQAMERARDGSVPQVAFSLSDASGLRVTKRRNVAVDGHKRTLGSQALEPSVPSNRSEAVRLLALLESLLSAQPGGWEKQCEIHDQVFAEVVLQVANHCVERGELLQRLRKFLQLVTRMERDSREEASNMREEARAARAALEVQEEKCKALEGELDAAKEKLDMLRAGMVRLKMLGAIHGRKLKTSEARSVSPSKHRDRQLSGHVDFHSLNALSANLCPLQESGAAARR